MRLRVTKAVNAITDKRFKELLQEGAFPEVHYEEGGMFSSFRLFEYSNTHARFMKYIDERVKRELGDRLGVFTRKHSAAFLSELEKIVDSVTEFDVVSQPDRFHSFADDVMGEAMK